MSIVHIHARKNETFPHDEIRSRLGASTEFAAGDGTYLRDDGPVWLFQQSDAPFATGELAEWAVVFTNVEYVPYIAFCKNIADELDLRMKIDFQDVRF